MKKLMQILGIAVVAMMAVAPLAEAQRVNTVVSTPAVAGSAPALNATGPDTNIGISITPKGSGLTAVAGFSRPIVSAASGTTALTAAQSGAIVANTGTSATTTFTLPVPVAGMNFCFVEAGDAGGELLVNGGTGVSIIGKTHGAENGGGISTTAGTGIKNTAATNVKGDFACVVAFNTTTWVMVSVAGVWATQ